MRDKQPSQVERQRYGDWFCGQVEPALREAEDLATEWISDEDVKADWGRRRVEILGQGGGQTR